MPYDFDQKINRIGTNSSKWSKYAEDVLPLWVADTDFAVPPQIIQRIKNRLEHPIFGYSVVNPLFIQAVQTRLNEKYAWNVAAEAIIPVPGIVSGFNFGCRAFCKPGDSVIFQIPAYPPFFEGPGNSGARCVTNEMRLDGDQYQIDFDDFEKKIEKDTKLFILCNPQNPTGRVFTHEELTKLGEICLRHGVKICSDEIHCDIVYSGGKHIPIASISPELERNTITFIAPSKTFNIPGLSCSVAIVPDAEMRAAFKNSLKGFSSGVTSIAQEAGIAAYTECADWLAEEVQYLQKNRDFTREFIAKNIPCIQTAKIEATFLAWLDCSQLGTERIPQEFFLNEAKVGLNDGAEFGEGFSRYVRLNFGACRATLEEALERMAHAVRKI